MGQNSVPHLSDNPELLSGGSLKDGWSYLVPEDRVVLDMEVSVAFADEIQSHIQEQAEALRGLYLSSSQSSKMHADKSLTVEEQPENDRVKHFIVNRGLQVVGVATYSESTGRLYDIAVRPSASAAVGETLLNAVKEHSRKIGRSGSLYVVPSSQRSRALFEDLGLTEADEETLETGL